VLSRIHQYLSMAAPLLWMQRRDRIGLLELAIAACQDGIGDVGDMLRTAQALWHAVPTVEGDAECRVVMRSVFQLIQLADIVVTTAE